MPPSTAVAGGGRCLSSFSFSAVVMLLLVLLTHSSTDLSLSMVSRPAFFPYSDKSSALLLSLNLTGLILLPICMKMLFNLDGGLRGLPQALAKSKFCLKKPPRSSNSLLSSPFISVYVNVLLKRSFLSYWRDMRRWAVSRTISKSSCILGVFSYFS